MSIRRLLTLTGIVAGGVALMTFPTALAVALILERWHGRHYDVLDPYGD